MFAVQQAANKITTVPAPIGGLNARDSLANMPETDCVAMQNFWPQPYGVTVRLGYSEWNYIPDANAIHTLGSWSGIAGEQKFFAWSTTNMWDISTKGAFIGIPLVTGLTNDKWQLTGMSNAAGGHLIAVNGADDGIVYDDTGVHRLIAGDGVAAYTWSGLDPKDAIQLTVHQGRLWATKKDSSSGYYLPPDAIYGVFKSFDFGPLFQRAGYLAFLTTWTIDDGNGAEDHLVAVSSSGYAAVYAGIDPSNAGTWSLVGVYYVGSPVKGRRGYTKVGGDLFILTQQGIISMSGMLSSTKVNDQKHSFPSDKIQFLMSEVISNYADLEGWQLAYYPKTNMLLCNVPSQTDGGTFQLACNQIISSWTQFSGMDAACWGSFSDQMFFADYKGTIWLAWDGYLDGVEATGLGGTAVNAYAQQAYSYFQSFGTQKQVGMYRPNFLLTADLNQASFLTYDFKEANPADPGAPPAPPGSVRARWDESKWNLSGWFVGGGSGGYNTVSWVQALGIGVAASLSITVRATGSALWISTDYSYKTGGLL